jgi:hypothetical protein
LRRISKIRIAEERQSRSNPLRGGDQLADGDLVVLSGLRRARGLPKSSQSVTIVDAIKKQPTMMPNSGSDGPVSATMLKFPNAWFLPEPHGRVWWDATLPAGFTGRGCQRRSFSAAL